MKKIFKNLLACITWILKPSHHLLVTLKDKNEYWYKQKYWWNVNQSYSKEIRCEPKSGSKIISGAKINWVFDPNDIS